MEENINSRILISKEELLKAIKRKGLVWKLLIDGGMRIFSLHKINKFYNLVYRKNTNDFIDAMFLANNNRIIINDGALDNIPETGPFIIVSNHPYGGWDGVALIRTISEKRPDIKFLVNFFLGKIEPLQPNIIEVNPFENHKGLKSNIKGLKYMHNHLNQGHPIGFFPAGEVSTYYKGLKYPMDKTWQANIVRLIHKSNLEVFPVFIPGTNSKTFHRLGKIHPLLRTLRLPKELLKLNNTSIEIHFGKSIKQPMQDFIKDSSVFGSFLKMRSYSISSEIEEAKKLSQINKMEEIIPCVPVDILKSEIENLKPSCFLFSIENYSCYLSEYNDIPNVFKEISRLRELSFREVGEGTGKAFDKDKFDEYYRHLFVWDNIALKIVGAYRVGYGKEIMDKYGVSGFYTSTLFNFKKGFFEYMEQGIELGRSFIVSEYQRKSSALFLLWKGIVYVLIKNENAKYMFGPASISNAYSEFAKILMVEFFKRHHGNKHSTSLVECKNKYRYKLFKDLSAIINYCEGDIKKIDRFIEEFDKENKKIPVLYKKYIAQGAVFIHFNVDPEFNNTIDGLMLSNIKDIPISNIQSFAKEIEDPELLKRFTQSLG